MPSTPTYIIIGENGDTLYARLMRAIGREDLVGPDYVQNHHRVSRQAEIEEAISCWTKVRPVEVFAVLHKVGISVGRVIGIKEIVENEQVKARGAVEDVVERTVVGGKSRCWASFRCCKDLERRRDGLVLILGNIRMLGLDTKELARLRDSGIIR